jgi:hypothetical protein
MSAAKNLSSTLFSCIIEGIPLVTALLVIGSAQARNDGFQKKHCLLPHHLFVFHPEHGMSGRELRAKDLSNAFSYVERVR